MQKFSSILKDISLPALLFLVFLSADSYVTAVGIAQGSSEGDSIVVWLWGILGSLKWILPYLWYIFAVFLGILCCRYLNCFLGLAWLYAVGLGHLLGFLSWTPLLYNMYSSTTLFIAAAILGIIASLIHLSIKKSAS